MEEVESIADALTASMNEASDAETETAEDTSGISEEAAQETEEEVVEAAETEVEEASEESEEPVEVFQAPKHWSSDERESFDALPPEAQELLLERDKAFQQGYQEKAEAISAITEALEPWKDALAQRGVTADQAIRALFAAQHSLDANPVQGILQIAQNYGIMDQLRSEFSPADDTDFTDPEVKALRQQVSQLERLVSQTQTGLQQQNTNAVQQQINDFASAKDADGNLKHPHFEQVKVQMAPLVQDGKSLDEAYSEAVWTVPEFRNAQLKAQAEQKKAQSDSDKAAKVKKAKRASRSVRTNGKASPSEGDDAMSLGDDLREAFRQHSA